MLFFELSHPILVPNRELKSKPGLLRKAWKKEDPSRAICIFLSNYCVYGANFFVREIFLSNFPERWDPKCGYEGMPLDKGGSSRIVLSTYTTLGWGGG